jgi:AcrR family transcriptional regulator
MVKQKDSKESPKESRESRESSDSRRQLLEAGTRLFARGGLEGTSVRDIAREAGTNICMISYHFGGKEGLYRACLQEFGEYRLNLTRGMLEAPASLAEFKVRLKLFLQALVDSNSDRPEFSQIIGKEIEAGLPVAADIFEMTFLEATQNILKFFRHAQDVGIVKKDIDPMFIAHFIYGTVAHLSRCHMVSKKYFKFSLTEQKNREKLVDTLVETLMSGVAIQN